MNKDSIVSAVSEILENPDELERMSKAARQSAIIDTNERIYRVIMELYLSK